MKSHRSDFYKYQAQTTEHPLALEVSHASGCYIYDNNNKPYLDFIAGVSACTLGHRHPKVVDAIKNQLDRYLHVMVYGEFIQDPAVELSKLLSSHLPKTLQSTYLTNSGTEAIEGAIKLAKRYTKRFEIISAYSAYHGNTMGAMSAMGKEEYKRAFRPLVPGIKFINFNNSNQIEQITNKTAAVLLETIQGGAGFITPRNDYLVQVKQRCQEVGALLILDEIQTGMGRTGSLFGFENFHCTPDILICGKGLGGGMPIGAFISSREIMAHLKKNPKMGHITTFGGHPVIAAAALATLKELINGEIMKSIPYKEQLIRNNLKHPLITEIRGKGLMLAAMTPSATITNEIILRCKDEGLLLFWLLFEPYAIRITPPLTISDNDLIKGCKIILRVLNSVAI